MPVGNAGNAFNGTTGYGAVGYNYSISKCEITAGQYTEFLNAVAGTLDPYGLYNPNMAAPYAGSQITKSGGVYTTTLPNQPVNYVSWGDVARFCNWMSNGQPTPGVENLSTTEDGSYYLNGAMTDDQLMVVTRKANAVWMIPSVNEWYKAAYYDPNKGGFGVGGYWVYPTKSNGAPSNVLSSTGTNNANYNHTLDVSPYTTAIGSFAKSLSAYGTLDQAGNVSEWIEQVIPGPWRVLRGGSFGHDDSFYVSSSCYWNNYRRSKILLTVSV